MFDSLALLPPDSILGLAAACRADSNPDKVDLTLGVYMDETGLVLCSRQCSRHSETSVKRR